MEKIAPKKTSLPLASANGIMNTKQRALAQIHHAMFG
jgi:hypothetical protein